MGWGWVGGGLGWVGVGWVALGCVGVGWGWVGGGLGPVGVWWGYSIGLHWVGGSCKVEDKGLERGMNKGLEGLDGATWSNKLDKGLGRAR